MREQDKAFRVFFALLKAGLWEQSVRLLSFSPIDFDSVYRLADEQSVVGLIASGFEQVVDTKIDKPTVMPFIKRVFSFEHRNTAMNLFIEKLVGRMRDEAGIQAVLIKGQGVAQCYAKPQWRSAGDVDFFFDDLNYEKAKRYLSPLASHIDSEDSRRKHLGMTIDSWTVELHGRMHTEISRRINMGVDAVQQDIFEWGGVRIWKNGNEDVYLPNPDNDVIIIFTHIIQHFFVGGVGLRQICDWCRLLWTYQGKLDLLLLENRLNEMGLMTEWKAFAFFAVKTLGMPQNGMPFYENSHKLSRQSKRICQLIMNAGNFGHNKDQSYRNQYSKLIEKSITFWRRLGEFIRLSIIFPLDGPRYFLTYVTRRTKAAL